MGFLVLFVTALIFAMLQHGPCAAWPAGPDLTLALAVWVVVGGGDRWGLVRAWLVGACRDAVDPGSTVFHAVTYTIMALAFLPLRGSVYRGRMAAWMGVSAAACLLLIGWDRWWIGLDPFADLVTTLSRTFFTALATLPLGWLLGGLPKAIRPVEVGEA